MIDDLVTPLEPLVEGAGGSGSGRIIYLKREDVLPFGGGNKVRRFLAWLAEARRDSDSSGADRGDGQSAKLHRHLDQFESIGVLSYRGAHTFLVLAEMFRRGLVPARSLTFWETQREPNPYTELVRRKYLDQPNIDVIGGGTVRLLGQMTWARIRGGPRRLVAPIGGSMAPVAPPYREPLDQCIAQLAALGHRSERVWHLIPASSGVMLDGLRRAIRDRGADDHRVIGVLTGPLAARLKVAWRSRAQRDVLLVQPQRTSWRSYLRLARSFFAQTGIWVDPTHMIYSVRVLRELPRAVQPCDIVVAWITCPRLDEMESLAERAP